MAKTLTSFFQASPKPDSSTSLSLEEGKYQMEEEQETSPSNIQKVVAELLGTYILVFIGCGSQFVDNITLVGVALAWGAAVVALVYSVGHISGAHLNPAVTLAFATIGRFPWKQAPSYLAVQVLGSIAASITLRLVIDGNRAAVMLTLPGNSTNDLNAVVLEIIISFILMFVIVSASDHRGTKELSGVAIGATIFFNVIVAGNITGCSMNPARSLGPAIATHNFRKIWIYIVSPVIGTIAGSILYQLFRSPVKKIEITEANKRSNPIYSGK